VGLLGSVRGLVLFFVWDNKHLWKLNIVRLVPRGIKKEVLRSQGLAHTSRAFDVCDDGTVVVSHKTLCGLNTR